jgi:hypothetical protein
MIPRKNNNKNLKKRLVGLTGTAVVTSLVASIAVIGVVSSVIAQQFQDQDLDQRGANNLVLNEEIGVTVESISRPAENGLPPEEEEHQCPVGFTLNHGTCETEPVINCPDPFEVSENRCILYDHEDTTAPGCLGGSLETGREGETACADLDEEPIKYRAKFCPQGYRFFDDVCTSFYTTDEPPRLVCPGDYTLNTETKTCRSVQLS